MGGPHGGFGLGGGLGGTATDFRRTGHYINITLAMEIVQASARLLRFVGFAVEVGLDASVVCLAESRMA